jgi:hypothetical protein
LGNNRVIGIVVGRAGYRFDKTHDSNRGIGRARQTIIGRKTESTRALRCGTMDIDKIRKEFDDYSQEYDGQRKSFIPFFDVFYEKSVSLVKYYKNDFSNIVDLGAGTGLFTAKIYELYRDAHYTLIDISNDMLYRRAFDFT